MQSKRIVRFLNILILGLVAGVALGIWLSHNPHALSPRTYVEQYQHTIRAMGLLMRIAVWIAMALTVISAAQQQQNKPVFIPLLCAVGFILVCGVITRFGNQPINVMILSWNIEMLPANWMELRDKWWTLHIMRSIALVIAFALVVWSSTRNNEA